MTLTRSTHVVVTLAVLSLAAAANPNPAAGAHSTSATLPFGPDNIAFAPTGTLLVSRRTDGAVAVALPDGSVQTVVPGGLTLHCGVAVIQRGDGESVFAVNRPREATAALEAMLSTRLPEFLRRHPMLVNGHRTLATARSMAGDATGALVAARAGLSIYPTDHTVLVAEARASFRLLHDEERVLFEPLEGMPEYETILHPDG